MPNHKFRTVTLNLPSLNIHETVNDILVIYNCTET